MAQAETLPASVVQSAENVNTPVFTVVPATQGAAPFEVQMNSYPNLGAGAGTYNHGMWFGWNASRFASGSDTPGAPGLYMGFEDNYYDSDGDESYGAEWYVGYTTPDGTTIGSAALRPFYFRVKASDTNTPDKSVIATIDIGSGSSGNFSVMGDVRGQHQLFVVTKQVIYARVRARFTAPGIGVQIQPTSGYAGLEIVAPGTGPSGDFGILAWRQGSSPAWSIAATVGGWAIRDASNGDRQHLALASGSSESAALTTMRSSLSVRGGFGVNGAAPTAKAAAIPAPADPGESYGRDEARSAVDAINSIRQVLSNIGLTER